MPAPASSTGEGGASSTATKKKKKKKTSAAPHVPSVDSEAMPNGAAPSPIHPIGATPSSIPAPVPAVFRPDVDQVALAAKLGLPDMSESSLQLCARRFGMRRNDPSFLYMARVK